MFGARETAFLDLAAIILDCVANRFFKVCIRFNESWLAIAGKPEHVVDDKDLPIAVRTRSDTNGGDANFFCD